MSDTKKLDLGQAVAFGLGEIMNDVDYPPNTNVTNHDCDDGAGLMVAFSAWHELQAICESVFNGAQYGMKIRFPHALVMTFLFRREVPLRRKLETIFRMTFQHMWSLAKFAGVYKTGLALLKYTSRRLDELGYGDCHHEKDACTHATMARSDTLSIRYLLLKGLQLFVQGKASLVSSPPRTQLRVLPRPGPGMPELSHHAFLAGAAGGYLVWGKVYSSLNNQIVMYLASRVLLGCAKLLISETNCDSEEEGNIVPATIRKLMRQYGYPVSATAVWGLVMMLFENHPHVLHSSLKRSMDDIYHGSSPPPPTKQSQTNHPS